MPDRAAGGVGPGRLLVGLYALLAVAASARSAVELAMRASRAPLAYVLSAAAAAVYVVGFLLVLRADTGRGRRATAFWCGLELCGVLAVGSASLVAPGAFPDASVWSDFGAGYLLLPVVLPVAVLVWLSGTRPGATAASGGVAGPGDAQRDDGDVVDLPLDGAGERVDERPR